MSHASLETTGNASPHIIGRFEPGPTTYAVPLDECRHGVPVDSFALSQWLGEDTVGRYIATPELLALAKSCAMDGWCERSKEMGRDAPENLQMACYSVSLLVKMCFGGQVRGNCDHQFNIVAGQVVDLAGQPGQKQIHDPHFFGNNEHLGIMQSFVARVNRWADRFNEQVAALRRSPPEPEYGGGPDL